MFRVRQHFHYLDLARFNEPAVENFQKQIALKIDKDWLGTVLAVTGVAKRSTVSKGAPAKRIKKNHDLGKSSHYRLGICPAAGAAVAAGP